MNITANKIINALGGTNAVANLCECRPASVSEWRNSGIPKARMLFFKAIRPDLFQDQPLKTEFDKSQLNISGSKVLPAHGPECGASQASLSK